MSFYRTWFALVPLAGALFSVPSVWSGGLAPEVDLIFGSRHPLATSLHSPGGVAVADIDADGNPDVVVTSEKGEDFRVYGNPNAWPNGAFAPAVSFGNAFGSAGRYPRVAVGDLDGDGLPEVVVSSPSTAFLQVFRNLSSPGVIDFAPAVLLGRSSGDLPPTLIPVDVELGDLDGDGRAEVVTTDAASAEIALFPNTSSPGQLSFGSRVGMTIYGSEEEPEEWDRPVPELLALGDLDGDGGLDIVVVVAPSEVSASDFYLLRNRREASAFAFDAGARYDSYYRLADLDLADVDRDSKLDVVTVAADVESRNGLRVWRNTAVAGALYDQDFGPAVTGAGGQQSLDGPFPFMTSRYASDLVVTDVDADGRPDVVIADPVGNLLTVQANESQPGELIFESLGEVRTGEGPESVAVGDLDGDGRFDLTVANTGAGSVDVRRNTAVLALAVNSGATIVTVPVADDDPWLEAYDFTITSGNPAVVPDGNLAFALVSGTGQLQITPAADASGSLRIKVRAEDAEQSETFQKLTVVVGCENNVEWPAACPMPLLRDPGSGQWSGAARQAVKQVDQSRWFKFQVQPESQVFVTLTELTKDFDLFVFRDIAQTYHELLQPVPADVALLGAEFAPAAFSPAAFSPAAFSPAAFSPAAFSPAAFSPAAFSPAAFSPAAFSPAAFSPAAFSPAAFSPAAFSPAAFSPAAFSPAAFSPAAFSPAAFSSAQTRSLVAVSAFEGTAGEGVFLNTWGSTGEFYVCVRGRNGTFDAGSPFRLDVVLVPGGCEGLVPAPAGNLVAVAGGFQTLVLADWGRMNPGTDPTVAAELVNLQGKLATFAARAEVAGVVVDVGADAAVAFANAQADAKAGCVFAKNLVAEAIRSIVVHYRDKNPGLESVMILGHDDVIPYFRHPDTSGLASEQNFVVPVLDQTASQASLRLGYVLSQDAYGTTCEVAQKFTTLPVADLPVGRLVETPVEIQGLLDAYLALPAGRLPTPTASLVTGYDFLVDAAEAIDAEFRAGMGLEPSLIHDRLIAPRGLSPEADPATTQNWSAAELAAILFARRHDLIFLAGHYNDGSALAADYATELTAADVDGSTVDMVNALIFGAGCHVGYNTVDPHSIPDVTQKPDWAQAFARKQVTAFIGGTGYQYGDTELIEYHERLYQEFARQLRTGPGPVSIGRALVEAKRAYLRSTASLRGIHEKTVMETTLFGFPMLTIDLPGERLPGPSGGSMVPATVGYLADPGLTLELKRADLTLALPTFFKHSVDLQQYGPTGPVGPVTATYLSGPEGHVNNPSEPILPLLVRNVMSPTPSEVLRGVGFRSGTYSDEHGVIPLTGMPATEIRGVAVTFESEFFFPVQPWSVGYFDSACGDGQTRLNLFPAQHQTRAADDTVSRRRFSELGFRLFYSGNTKTYTDAATPGVPSTPWLAEAPSISHVTDSLTGTDLTISALVVGNPSAGIQEVWVTYTAVSGDWHGRWQSLDLGQQVAPVFPEDSRVWQGTLALPAGVAASDVRYVVQAVNGVGLVTMDSNQGRYFTPGHSPAVEPSRQVTTLTFENFPLTRAYGEIATFSAVLATPAGPVAGERVSFGFGNAHLVGRTDAQGRAQVTLPLVNQPAVYKLQAHCAGSSTHRSASATTQFNLVPQETFIQIEDLTTTRPNLNVRATLMARNGQALPNGDTLSEQSLFFVLTDASGQVLVARPVATDYVGRAPLGVLPLGAGTYTLRVYFNGQIPLEGAVSSPSLATQLSDPRYEASSATGVFTFNLVAAPQTLYRAAGRTAKISGPILLAATQGIEGAILNLVSVQSALPAGASVRMEDGGLWVIYEPAAGPDSPGSFTYTISDQFGTQATGLVTVDLLSPSTDPTLNIVSVQSGANGSVILTFIGIPGLSYAIQARESLNEGVPWVTLAQRSAGPNGHFTYTDTAPTPMRYYRAVGP